eukprot:TRINITY_DN1551_c0_g1_i1.p1 TRINITY_DN1551_c0_g1~~TRINITY_DN1551_c0_g1_i1.p1  ORF type:complete len:207 (-),score=70.06 TRINITY_DN1551_c0_g1_i1:57-632(-)
MTEPATATPPAAAPAVTTAAAAPSSTATTPTLAPPVASPAPDATTPPEKEPSQETLITLLDDLWNNRNFKVIDDVLSIDCVNRGPLVNTTGVKEFKTLFVLPLLNAFPDLKYICHEVIQQHSTFVIRYSFSGTHMGPYRGYEPTKKKIFWSGVCINRINTEGRLYEISYYFDSKLLFNQLANTPASATKKV